MSYFSHTYGEAFRDDEVDPDEPRLRVYVASDGSRWVGHDTADMFHYCSADCGSASIPEGYEPADERGDSFINLSEIREGEPKHDGGVMLYADTIDVGSFDPGDDAYVICAQCGVEMLRDDDKYLAMYGVPIPRD